MEGADVGPMRPTSGVGEIEDLAHTLTLLSKIDWTAHPSELALEALADLEMLRARLDGLCIGLTGERGTSLGAALAGHRSVASFLKTEVHFPKPEADRRAGLARRINDRASMRAVATALIEGRIGFAQAALIGKYSIADEVSWAFDDAVEAFFLPVAEQKDWAFFQRACLEWFEQRDVTQGEARDRRQDARQKVRVSTSFDGMVRIDGWLPTVEGSIFSIEYERLRRHLYDQDYAEARAKLGRDPKPDELGRTADERSVAVLVLMAQRSASFGEGPVSALPCVNVMVDYKTFAAATSELMGLPALYPAGGVRRTEMGLPVSPRTVVETLLQGHIRRVVFDPKGQVLDVGRKSRFFTGGLREAVMLQDQTCVEPGCEVPARFCEVDHCQSWADLGTTCIGNGNCRCRFHNGLKGSRSVDPIYDQRNGSLGFHVDPHVQDKPFVSKATYRKRPSSQPPMPEPRSVTGRNQC